MFGEVVGEMGGTDAVRPPVTGRGARRRRSPLPPDIFSDLVAPQLIWSFRSLASLSAVGACRSVHRSESLRTFGASCYLGGGQGGGSHGACGLSSRLRCGRLAAMAALAVWWLAFRHSVAVCSCGPCAWPHQSRRRSMLAGVKTLSGFGQTDGGGACGHRHLPEVSVVVAPSLRRAPDENLIFGSDGGGTAVSCPSRRHRLGAHGFVEYQLHLFAISSSEGHRRLCSDAYCPLL